MRKKQKRDWKKYNDQLVKRGELLIDLDFRHRGLRVSTDRYVKSKRTKIGPGGKPLPRSQKRRKGRSREDRELDTVKLHVLTGYCIGPKLLPVRSATVTRTHAHDSPSSNGYSGWSIASEFP